MTCLTSGVSHSKNVSHALKKIDPIAPNEIFLYGPSCIACTHSFLSLLRINLRLLQDLIFSLLKNGRVSINLGEERGGTKCNKFTTDGGVKGNARSLLFLQCSLADRALLISVRGCFVCLTRS